MLEQTATRMVPHATPKDDQTLVQQVYRALDGVEPLRVLASPVQVQVSDGTVTLSGVVATYSIKAQVLWATHRVRGVGQVRDELLTDDDLEIRVAHALSADPRTHRAAFGIIVNAINGFVSLVGHARTPEAAQTTEAISSGVPGVRAVSNRLQVRSKGIREMYVLLADNRATERTVLRRLLEREPELSVVGEAVEARNLLAQAWAVHPDLVLLDWELPGLQGTDLLPTLRCLGCPLKVVAYSERKEARQEALAAGADAFFSKDEPLEWLLITLYSVAGLSPCIVG